MAANSEAKVLSSRVASIASSLDGNVGGKFQETVKGLPVGSPEKENLIYSTNALCQDVKKLKATIGEDSERTFCSTH